MPALNDDETALAERNSAFIGTVDAGDNVTIRVLGDFAIVHTHIAWTPPGDGRFTDDYTRRDGRWQCVSAHVITYFAPPVTQSSLI